jgi:hypothetical protein
MRPHFYVEATPKKAMHSDIPPIQRTLTDKATVKEG